MAIDNVRETYGASVSDVNEVGSVNGSTIRGSIETLSQDMDKYKFEVFKSNFKRDDIDLSQINSALEIPDDLKGEYADFKLSNEQMMASDSPYSAAKTRVIQTLEERDKKINRLIGEKANERKGELQELLSEAEKTLEESEKELEQVDQEIQELQSKDPLTDEDKNHLKELNEKKTKLSGDITYLQSLTGKSKSEGTRSIQELIDDCTTSAKATQSTKKEAIKALGGIVGPYAINGENVVYSDQDISKSLGEYDKEKDFLNNVSNKVEEINKDGEQIEDSEKKEEQEQGQQEQQANNAQQKAGTIPPELAAKLAQQMGTNGKSSISNEAVIGDDGLDEELNLEPDYLSMLGYNPDNSLNFNNSSDLLTNFANNFTDRARLEMLNNPECKNVILKALAVTGKNLSPKKAKLFNDTRDRLLKLAKGPMMEMALKDIGIENPENIKKEFNDANKFYNNKRKEIEDKLAGRELSDEQKQSLENELNELDSKYESIKNVADFRKSTNKIKTIRSRIISFKDAILSKDTYKQTVKAIGSKAEDAKEVASNVKDSAVEKAGQAKDKAKEVVGNAKESVNNFLFVQNAEKKEKEAKDERWMKGLVKDQNERVEAEVKRLENDKNTKDTKEKSEQDKTI